MPTLFDLFNQFDLYTVTDESSILYPPRCKDLSREITLLPLLQVSPKGNGKLEKTYRIKKKNAETNAQKLQQKIELLRLQLHHLANQKGFLDQSVIELSQKLDTYIVLYQRLLSPDKK